MLPIVTNLTANRSSKAVKIGFELLQRVQNSAVILKLAFSEQRKETKSRILKFVLQQMKKSQL